MIGFCSYIASVVCVVSSVSFGSYVWVACPEEVPYIHHISNESIVTSSGHSRAATCKAKALSMYDGHHNQYLLPPLHTLLDNYCRTNHIADQVNALAQVWMGAFIVTTFATVTDRTVYRALVLANKADPSIRWLIDEIKSVVNPRQKILAAECNR